MTSDQNAELAKFGRMAEHWWDTSGEMRPLHDINPLRTDFIDRRAPLAGKRVLDVGCGAGILSEALARRGAQVTGLDLAPELIEAAKAHAEDSGLDIDYRCISSGDLMREAPGAFDIVVCYEMLEHVDTPAYVVDDCAMLTAPGGNLFFSTINRSPKAWLLAIGGAEYVLGLLPRGTHEYSKLIRPSELGAWCRRAHLEVAEIAGMHYNPFTRRASLTQRPDVNYFLHARKPAASRA
ncbi:bifunctional 2-polyprenyl-6-hydroxyphenol methylase/3-demethylubiquinol 3-O-methyltransferase UbiG [Salinisphaera sp.]|uniref:bifunctional 2-polyprenyl-6-hydroxyphenol methylase/3-demethylubiquinol 3-O-methyltransferase UbiG n=1 Tax=Salinisphaera sp. TaxID=1914330 RepID=UPI000C538113|nr:bifunctional 2-polyprenyl-6-hydroxyphenol methylase/3-demethylubiquinol 3-O-methyltransferase UbiG [Salinisphaera sp.]MBS62497.1 bifunctional 3-demethylubiquinol 3-O-methyltransferase/2-polyprenyl-6-hydroxyphenol methylase [Salinisphaera sp.]